MPKLEAVIFDLGGVLTLPQSPEKVDELRALLGSPLDREAFAEAYRAPRLDYDRGLIGRDEYWSRVAEGARPGDGSMPSGAARSELLERLTRVDIEGWFNIRPEMVELVRRLKTELGRVALLSNINRECAGHLEANFDWIGLFDVVVYSCDHLLLKPERAIFDLCLAKLGLRAERCLFIDDIEENVEGARAAGLEGHRFVERTKLDEALARF